MIPNQFRVNIAFILSRTIKLRLLNSQQFLIRLLNSEFGNITRIISFTLVNVNCNRIGADPLGIWNFIRINDKSEDDAVGWFVSAYFIITCKNHFFESLILNRIETPIFCFHTWLICQESLRYDTRGVAFRLLYIITRFLPVCDNGSNWRRCRGLLQILTIIIV